MDMYSERRPGIISFSFWFSLKGRLSRLDWWGSCILIYLLMIVGVAAGGAAGAIMASDEAYVSLIALAVILGTAASITIGVRRLHDMNLSGWWVLPVILVDIFLRLLYFRQLWETASATDPGTSIFLVAELLILAVWFGLIPGTTGANRFGPVKKESAKE